MTETVRRLSSLLPKARIAGELPIGRWYALLAAIVSAGALADAWFLSGVFLLEIVLLPAAVGLGLYWLAMMGVAIAFARRHAAFWMSFLIGPVLAAGTFAVVSAELPLKMRFRLSQSALDDYVRTVKVRPVEECRPDYEAPYPEYEYKATRVGRFDVLCAKRIEAGRLLLLTDDEAGYFSTTYLEWTQEADAKPGEDSMRLGPHWNTLVVSDQS